MGVSTAPVRHCVQISQIESTCCLEEIDPQLGELDGLLCQTAYRVIQEAVTNVLRHANAGSINVTAAIEAGELLLEISDDGVGFPERHVFGRGLTGMRERVRALGGTFELLRERRVTSVRCRLPVHASPVGRGRIAGAGVSG